MEIETLPPYTDNERATAYEALERVDQLVDEIGSFQAGLETNFVRLGKAVHDVKTNQYWMVVGFSSFGAYLTSLEPRLKMGRSQLYYCVGIAKELLPTIPEDQLVEIGITKAKTVRNLVKAGCNAEKAAQVALRSTNDELLAILAEAQGLRAAEERGKWMTYGGAFYDEDERKEFMRALNLALEIEPPINCGGPFKKMSDVPPQVKKEVFWRWLATFVAEHEAEIEQSGLR